MGREGKNWRGLEPGDDVSQLEMKLMLVSGIFKQLRIFVVVPDVFKRIFEDRESFLLQGKCAMSVQIPTHDEMSGDQWKNVPSICKI